MNVITVGPSRFWSTDKESVDRFVERQKRLYTITGIVPEVIISGDDTKGWSAYVRPAEPPKLRPGATPRMMNCSRIGESK